MPFEVLGLHSDNGSEYVNYRVAELLEKLHIEFTKSRARHSNDNALVECKNTHVLRKLLGHAHIPRQCAEELNEFHQRHLNWYVNYHRRVCLHKCRPMSGAGSSGVIDMKTCTRRMRSSDRCRMRSNI